MPYNLSQFFYFYIIIWYLVQNGLIIHLNNFEFRISKIINILIDEINEIFKEPFINENILNDDYWIKPDWGSIAPVSKKEFCEE